MSVTSNRRRFWHMMPVNSTHADYDANLPAWVRARDVFAGEDAVKAAAEKYLPRLDLQDDNDYLAYKTGLLFSTPPPARQMALWG
jgi:hypothetical protein